MGQSQCCGPRKEEQKVQEGLLNQIKEKAQNAALDKIQEKIEETKTDLNKTLDQSKELGKQILQNPQNALEKGKEAVELTNKNLKDLSDKIQEDAKIVAAAAATTTEAIKKVSGTLQAGKQFLEKVNQFVEPAKDKTIEEQK